MSGRYLNHNIEGSLIKIENLYKSIFTDIPNTFIELGNSAVSIKHDDNIYQGILISLEGIKKFYKTTSHELHCL